jgi:hypothetical protein
MRVLQVQPLAFPETTLAQWKQGHHDILSGLRPECFLRRILEEKIHKSEQARPTVLRGSVCDQETQ